MKNTRVFTPQWMVIELLKLVGYVPHGDIVRKHVMDNSCGDGALLCVIVEWYCLSSNGDASSLKKDLETYIHGIEIDQNLCIQAKRNLSDVAARFGIDGVKWDIVNEDALIEHRYDGKMDFVVGNPPYMKVHDFGEIRERVKSRRFTGGGMQDLYVAFFDVGISMLNEQGRMVYITPNTWTTSVYGRQLREYLSQENLIHCVGSCMGYKVFENADTYSLVTVLDKRRKTDDLVSLYLLNGRCFDYYVARELQFFVFDGKFLFNGGDIGLVRRVHEVYHSQNYHPFKVKNGFATLKDNVFIVNEGDMEKTDTHVIPCIKASKGILSHIIFPYDENGNPVAFFKIGPKTQALLKNRMEANKLPTDEDGWWLYGRTQAIKDVYKDKYAVSNIMDDAHGRKITPAPEGVGVYSGLYVTCEQYGMLDYAMSYLERDEMFLRYLIALGHYKDGGYYTFSSKELEMYLNYMFNIKKEKNENIQ